MINILSVNRLYLFCVCFCLSCILTSCGKDDVTVLHYKIDNCQLYVNLRSEPNTNSNIVAEVYQGTEVEKIRYIREAPFWEEWMEIKVKETGMHGYVMKKFVTCWSTKEKKAKETLSQRLAGANQHVTPKLFKFIESIGSTLFAPLMSKTIISSSDGSNWNTRLFWVISAVIMALVLGCVIYLCEQICWWHYLLALVFIPLEIMAFFSTIQGSLSFQIDNLIFDIIVNLIAFVLILSVPVVQWYSSVAFYRITGCIGTVH